MTFDRDMSRDDIFTTRQVQRSKDGQRPFTSARMTFDDGRRRTVTTEHVSED